MRGIMSSKKYQKRMSLVILIILTTVFSLIHLSVKFSTVNVAAINSGINLTVIGSSNSNVHSDTFMKDDIISYLHNKYPKVNYKRMADIVEWIRKYTNNTKVSPFRVIAMIENESKFKNYRSQFSGEDSDGYVQMKSSTIKYLKKKYPELPYISSQLEFRKNPEAQIRYMVAYLTNANNLFDDNTKLVVSSYNMGLGNTLKGNINTHYVNNVNTYKNKLEAFARQ